MRGKFVLCILDENTDKIIAREELNVDYSILDSDTSKQISSGLNIHHELMDSFYRDLVKSIDKQMIENLIKEVK